MRLCWSDSKPIPGPAHTGSAGPRAARRTRSLQGRSAERALHARPARAEWRSGSRARSLWAREPAVPRIACPQCAGLCPWSESAGMGTLLDARPATGPPITPMRLVQQHCQCSRELRLPRRPAGRAPSMRRALPAVAARGRAPTASRGGSSCSVGSSPSSGWRSSSSSLPVRRRGLGCSAAAAVIAVDAPALLPGPGSSGRLRARPRALASRPPCRPCSGRSGEPCASPAELAASKPRRDQQQRAGAPRAAHSRHHRQAHEMHHGGPRRQPGAGAQPRRGLRAAPAAQATPPGSLLRPARAGRPGRLGPAACGRGAGAGRARGRRGRRGLQHGRPHRLVIHPVRHRLHQVWQQRGRAVDELAELVHLRAARARARTLARVVAATAAIQGLLMTKVRMRQPPVPVCGARAPLAPRTRVALHCQQAPTPRSKTARDARNRSKPAPSPASALFLPPPRAPQP